jgi:hypothetical protein
MKLQHENHDTYEKTFFHTIYNIYFSRNYQTEKSTVEIYHHIYSLLRDQPWDTNTVYLASRVPLS